MKLHLADNLALPIDAVTQTFGILAKRRAGKSYAARRFTEQLFKLTAKGKELITTLRPEVRA